MKTARSYLLQGFILAFLLLILTQVLILTLGMTPIMNTYSKNQSAYLQDLARKILINPQSVSVSAPEHAGPFFVFSADKTLLYTNRGKGRSIPQADYTPIEYKGSIIGYYYAGELRFLDSNANRLFMTGLTLLFAGSIVFSLLIAAIAALMIARRITAPVALLQQDINALQDLKPVESRELPVEELSGISRSLHTVSTLLAGEEEYKRQWMQNIAHDLRTPISGLRGQLEGMRDGVLPAVPERFNNTLVEVQRLEELAQAVSELYRLENLRTIETSQFSAQRFASELEASFGPSLNAQQMEFVIEIQTEGLTANQSLLTRAVGNIIGNAVKYAGEGTRVILRIEKQASDQIIKISNNGPSIPEDRLDRIFQRFFRGEWSRTSTGTGLGLNIAAEIVHRHHGSLKAENLHSGGVEFIITIPNK